VGEGIGEGDGSFCLSQENEERREGKIKRNIFFIA
jgi:hypothetical protein